MKVIQVFEGTVIKRQNGGAKDNFHSKKDSPTVLVLRRHGHYILQSLEKIQVVRKGKVRRAKLYYLRERIGKKAKVKELVK